MSMFTFTFSQADQGLIGEALDLVQRTGVSQRVALAQGVGEIRVEPHPEGEKRGGLVPTLRVLGLAFFRDRVAEEWFPRG